MCWHNDEMKNGVGDEDGTKAEKKGFEVLLAATDWDTFRTEGREEICALLFLLLNVSELQFSHFSS